MSNTRKNYITWWKDCYNKVTKEFPEYEKYLKLYDFGFNNRKRAFGVCYFGALKKIELSEYLCKNMKEEEIKDTILHEMAHAVDACLRGFSNHDKEWKIIALSFGATPLSYSKQSRKIISKYVCVLEKFNGDLILKYTVNRLDSRLVLNEKVKGLYIKGQKANTLNKLKYLTWDEWSYYCETNDLSPFMEDWSK